MAGTVLVLQPLQYTWLGAGIRFMWLNPPDGIAYFLPMALAGTAGFALLPALLLATAAGWGWRRLLTAVVVTVTAMFLVQGWLAPAAMQARDGQADWRLQNPSSAREVRLYANSADLIAMAWGPDRQLARAARIELQRNVQVMAIGLSFALVGLALGRLGSRAFRNPSVVLLTVCWFAGWTLYQAFGYWGPYMVVLLSLPGATGSWVGPLVFALIAGAVLLTIGHGGAEAPPSTATAPR